MIAARRRPATRFGLMLAAAATAAGCGGSAGSDLATGTPSPSSTPPASAGPTLQPDERLSPGVRYDDTSDFDPAISFAVPNRHWYAYLRGNGALSLRVATGPAEADAVGKGIEIVQVSGTIDEAFRQLFGARVLRSGEAHVLRVANGQGQWRDVTVLHRAALSMPASLDGEQVDPGEGVRVFAINDGGSTTALALVITDARADLDAFLPEATSVVKSLRIAG